jgi:16S rRNA (cytosine967-C5)-methyltransferase
MSKLPVDSLAFALLQAAQVVAAIAAGRSLAEGLPAGVPTPARPAVQDLAYATLRRFGRDDFFLDRLLAKPLSEPVVRALLLVALQRLENRPQAVHVTVDQAVEAAGRVAGGRLRGLVNGVLRNYLRQSEMLVVAADADPVAAARHPAWWLASLQHAWPAEWPAIIDAGNAAPPMALRVNCRRTTRDAYRGLLAAADISARPVAEAGLALTRPLPIDRLPGFADGLVSVQDPGAQRAAELLAPAPGSRVLDACAAPGGKTAHLLEMADLDLLALDLKPTRCRRVEESLTRLGLTATVRAADCALPDTWWDGRPFDAVLADVPCSTSGVVRRHPDAKWLRRPQDIAGFVATQARILDALWQLVRPGGKLLYATCSVFPEENAGQIVRFLAHQPTARRCHEEQLLPDADHDGFYYCLLAKPG